MQSFDAWAAAGHNNTTTAMAIIHLFGLRMIESLARRSYSSVVRSQRSLRVKLDVEDLG
jgi:hypothetical protein